MTKAVAEDLYASVVGVADLDLAYPGVASFKARVALDVRIEQGSLSIGKCVLLSGPQSSEMVQIVGIEMPSHSKDSDVVRVLCSKPAILTIPAGKLEGWSITEQ